MSDRRERPRADEPAAVCYDRLTIGIANHADLDAYTTWLITLRLAGKIDEGFLQAYVNAARAAFVNGKPFDGSVPKL